MADVVFVAVLVAFFALASAYVSLCEHIVGESDRPTEDAPHASTGEAEILPDRF